MDALSSIVELFKLKSSVYFKSDFPSGWGMRIPEGPYSQFHIIVDGQCYLQYTKTDQTRILHKGDIVVFPHGNAHQLSHDLDSDLRNGQEVVRDIGASVNPFNGKQPGVTIICGHFELDHDLIHPLFTSLPPIIHIPDHVKQEYHWLESICDIIINETGSYNPGANALVSKLAEVLLIQVLRTYAQMSKLEFGFLAALNDPTINRAMVAMHTKPNESWTVESLARYGGISRTLFANKFRKLVGTTPLNYLTDWRMLKAKELLKKGNTPLNMIAESVGYRSEAAFIRVFRKKFDLTPGKFRRRIVEEAA